MNINQWPTEMTKYKTMKEFGATNYLVKKSRDVKKQKGILGICDKNKGKTLSEELKNDVCGFYECDDNSRMCPGMKDSVSVRNKDGEKVQHQKRLVLSNLKELHSSWKETYPEKKIGFSSLRPKWCVLAGSSGTAALQDCFKTTLEDPHKKLKRSGSAL
ncbi:uncharacterized protein LOC143450136 [Clavelina lepadiformis]|uniref:uncharacterized protein LOC143450136 n=1 Tax=Clavelina lepadiformis TaxID=159417 RepID=UPI004041A2C9